MKKDNTIYRIINGQGENRRLDRRYVFLGLFIFVMVATFSFFYTRGMGNANAVDLSGFKAGNIMSDAVMRNYTSMSEAEIQSFLNKKNSCGKTVSSISGMKKASGTSFGIKYQYKYTYDGTTYYYHVEDGKFVCLNNEKFDGETAAHIIYQAAKDYKINPQVLIVLLQKEQGLITDQWPNINHQYRSATGYGCPDNAPCNSEYYGFKNQVRKAAELFDIVLSGKSKYYPVKKTSKVRWSPKASCGSSDVYIENYATSALYRYTPYQPNSAALKAGYGSGDGCSAYGNRNFYAYFTDWFGSTQTVPVTSASIYFPEETFEIEVGEGKYLVPLSKKEGSKFVVTDDVSKENRQYKFTKNGNYYTITHVTSGFVIDSKNDTLTLAKADNTSDQKWRFSLSGKEYIIHSSILDNQVIDVTDGAKLEFYDKEAKQTVKIKSLSEDVVGKGPYLIMTTGGKAMDVEDDKTSNGTKIVTWKITYKKYQQHTITRGEDGFYRITNVASNKAIDVANASTSNGAKLQLYTSNDSCAQKWSIEKSGEGFKIISACSGKAIDVPDGSVSSNLKKLQIYTDNGTAAQVWKFEELPSEEELKKMRPIDDGEYIIYSGVGNGKDYVLDVYGSTAKKAKNGANIQIYKNINADTHRFKVTYNADKKLYNIISTGANRSLDVSGGSQKDRANIQLYDTNNTCAQLWRIVANEDDTYTFVSSCSDKVLDVSGGSARNEANVQLYSLNNTKAQKWIFKKL